MQDFTSIVNMISDMIMYLFSLRIPLGSDFSISFGSFAIGCFFLVILSHIPRWIFGVSYNIGSEVLREKVRGKVREHDFNRRVSNNDDYHITSY